MPWKQGILHTNYALPLTRFIPRVGKLLRIRGDRCWQEEQGEDAKAERAEGIQVERKERNMSESLDASLSGFVNVLGVLVFVSITVYHVVTANRKDIAS
ncbi:unnamed protein product [Ectocarpus sp. 12 AP-2014]